MGIAKWDQGRLEGKGPKERTQDRLEKRLESGIDHPLGMAVILPQLESIKMVSAVIVAAGKGTRMGPNTDKLFLNLNGRPLVAHTWRRFDEAACIDEIVLVIRDGLQRAFNDLAEQYRFRKHFRLVPGGKQRQDSVWNGLEAVSPAAEIVAIQDGARPCTSEALIAATVQAARETGAAVAAQPVVDTIKESADGKLIQRTLDRSRLWAVQTPQTFRLEIIRRALAEVRRRGQLVTDDTAACELIGQPVQLVVSLRPNPKVTRPEDLPWIETLVRREDEGG
jgi:2-C-methyl-D-erythritol 4-phosphate cytidylyltransferase